MLNIKIDVIRGITFIRLEGNLTGKTFKAFNEGVNYLLYKQGMRFFIINFRDIKDISQNIIGKLNNKLNEIIKYKSKVVVCGINNTGIDKKFFVNDELEALKCFNI